MKTIPYGRQFIDNDDLKAVENILKSDYLTQGPTITKFEQELCKKFQVKYVSVFNSGTSALHAIYRAAGVEKNTEIITSPLTFVATANAALYLDAKPVFCDVNPETGNIDIEKIEDLITDKTRAIVPVHYAGISVDAEKVYQIAQKYNNLVVIEDACHAIGSRYKNKPVGSCEYSDAAVFSFHPVKNMTTGEGGAVLTNNKKLYDKVNQFRNHGITKEHFINKSEGDWYYEMQHIGFNYRMTDLQAALGLSQLKKLDYFVKRRQEIYRFYHEKLKKNPYFDLPYEQKNTLSALHLFPIRLKGKYVSYRKKIFDTLRQKNIWVQVHYIPVYWQPFYQKLGYRKGLCPLAEQFYKSIFTLPIFPAITTEELNYVVKTVWEVLDKI